jgi:hypothetical protein
MVGPGGILWSPRPSSTWWVEAVAATTCAQAFDTDDRVVPAGRRRRLPAASFERVAPPLFTG